LKLLTLVLIAHPDWLTPDPWLQPGAFPSAAMSRSSIVPATISGMLLDVFSLLFVLTLGVLTPGPDFLLVVKNSAGGSRGRAFATVAGIAAGLLVQLSAISLGLTIITPEVMRAVQLGGAAFLVWIAVRTLVIAARVTVSAASGPSEHRSTLANAFVEGLGCNLTNPKAFLFYVGMFAHVLRPGVASFWRVALPLLFVVHAGAIWTGAVFALQSPPVARRFARAQRWLPWAFGVALLLLAIWIAIDAW
jgi:threonine/homoserine/homoserine lactone efflux protein